MYRIVTTDGTELGVTDSVLYIKKSASGAFVVAEKEDAIGVAFGSDAYNLEGHSDIDGAETVSVIEESLTEWAKAKKDEQADTDNMVVDHEYRLSLLELSIETSTETE